MGGTTQKTSANPAISRDRLDFRWVTAEAMTAHLPDWDLWNELLVQLYRAIDPVEHTETMLAVIQKLVPGESVILNILDLPTRNLSVVSVPADLLRPDEVELVAGYLHESPFPAYYVATGDPHWKMTTDFMPPEDFHATDLHRIGLSRWEANLQICGMLAIVDDTVHGVVINRASRGFDERERDILNALHPHLVTSYLNARAFGRAQDSVAELKGVMETAPGAFGCFREDGSLGWMQERARTWLREFFPDELVDPQGLPASIRRLVKKSRAAKNAPAVARSPSGRPAPRGLPFRIADGWLDPAAGMRCTYALPEVATHPRPFRPGAGGAALDGRG